MVVIKRFLATAAAVACLGGGALALTAGTDAEASTAITGTTQVTAQPDTTSVPAGDLPGACDTTSTYAKTFGPVWADDDFKASLSAVSTGTDTWAVTIRSAGNFAGFADPATCAGALSSGSLFGTIRYTVTSDNTPSQANLQSSYASFSDNLNGLVAAFFADPTLDTASFGDGTYSYSYQSGNMTEDNAGIFGDVTSNGGQVPDLTVSADSSTSVLLSWGKVPGATGYTYSVSGAGITSAPQTTTMTSTPVTGLTAGTAYTFTVSAQPSASGSATVTYTIPVVTPPAADSVLVKYVCGRSSARYVWTVTIAGGFTPAIANELLRVGHTWTWDRSVSQTVPSTERIVTSKGHGFEVFIDADGSRPRPLEKDTIHSSALAPSHGKSCG